MKIQQPRHTHSRLTQKKASLSLLPLGHLWLVVLFLFYAMKFRLIFFILKRASLGPVCM